MERFSKLAAHALERSLHIAEEMGHSYIGSEHLLYGLLKETEGVASRLLQSKGITADRLRRKMAEQRELGSPSLLSIHDMTPRMESVITDAGQLALRFGFSAVGTDHLLMALCEHPETLGYKFLSELKADPKKLHLTLRERMGAADLPLQTEKAKKGSGKTLSRFSRDLTKEALLGKLPLLIGRERELSALMRVLVRQNKNNPCLIGEAGVGKTVLIEGLAQKIAKGHAPAALKDFKIYALDLPAMIAGTKYRGEFEERLRSLLDEVEKDPSVVLFIDEMHLLAGAGAAEGAIDAANILKPAMARGRIKVIGATTLEEYRRHIEKDGALERRFAPIYIKEATEKETLQILEGLRPALETHHELKIPDETLFSAIRLSVQYINDRYLPDKAIDLLDEAAARSRLLAFSEQSASHQGKILQLQQELEGLLRSRQFPAVLEKREELDQLKKLESAPKERSILSPAALREVVQERTGIPIARREEDRATLCRELEQTLTQELIGQQEAITAICSALLRAECGLSDPNRPFCSLLFCGPTGVGKTRLCRLLAKTLFGKEEALIKIDMGEYMEAHSVSKLIGSPPGYIGHDRGGNLVNRIRERPYQVILFDEIEKAHPDVLHLLLALLDEGHLTDGMGKRADFRNCIIILTSNLGSAKGGKEPLGFGSAPDRAEEEVRSALKKALRPELLGRLDEIIIFRKLARDDLLSIAALELAQLQDRLFQQGYCIEFHEDVAAFAVDRSKEKEGGARAVLHTIEREIGGALARKILEGSLTDGLLRAADLQQQPLMISKG